MATKVIEVQIPLQELLEACLHRSNIWIDWRQVTGYSIGCREDWHGDLCVLLRSDCFPEHVKDSGKSLEVLPAGVELPRQADQPESVEGKSSIDPVGESPRGA